MNTSAAVSPPELSAPLLAIGLVLALLGWVLYWGGITALGAALGAGFGTGMGALVAHLAEWHGPPAVTSMVIGGVGGVILGALALRVAHALVFFLCGIVVGSLAVHQGLILARQLEWTWTQGDMAEILIRAGGAFVGGSILVLLSKFIIVIVTSTLGTILIVASWPTDAMLVAAIPIWLISMALQYFVARRLNLFAHAQRPRMEPEE